MANAVIILRISGTGKSSSIKGLDPNEVVVLNVLGKKLPFKDNNKLYNKDKKSIDMVEWGQNDEYWKVRVDRNRMITLMVEQIRDIGRLRLNGTPDEWSEFAKMFGNIYREKIEVKETKGKDDRSLYGNEYVWKRSGPDHFCHALLYALVGMQRYGGAKATVMEKDTQDIPGAWSVPGGGREGVIGREAVVVAGLPPSAFNNENRIV